MDQSLIKELRELTGAGVLDIKKALEETNNDKTKTIEILRKKGQKVIAEKSLRSAKEGIVGVYLHSNNKLVATVALKCETDFVARNEEFKTLAHDLAMHIAATNPQWISPNDIPADILSREKEIYSADENTRNKPVVIREKIIEGKLEKLYNETCLLKQAFVKDESLTVEQLVKNYIAKLRENIVIEKFIRFQL